MIDLNQLRDEPQKVKELLLKKDPAYDADRLIELDKTVRDVRYQVEELRKHKNELAQLGKKGVTPELIEKSKLVGKELKDKEARLEKTEAAFNHLYLRAPNLPEQDVPAGGKEQNKEISSFGSRPRFNFEIKNHLELGERLGWLDFKKAATMTGNNFVLYQGVGFALLNALIQFMLRHNASRGFEFIFPPFLVNEKSLEVSGNFPKFKEDVYEAGDDLYLIPTAEVALSNMYRDTIFKAEQLPIKLTAGTSCFRREAGGYGAQERGLIRLHQFEKVELFAYTKPQKSEAMLSFMLDTAEQLLQKLGLHYRVMLLAAEDTGFQSAKTYDLEIWMPSQERYVEVSSCSDCRDFQARRGMMRYRKEEGGKTHFVHTLNGSSLALPRLIAAIMETYQQDNGTIKIPEVLKHYM